MQPKIQRYIHPQDLLNRITVLLQNALWHRMRLWASCMCLVLLFSGCSNPLPTDDLTNAKNALKEHQIADAEMFLLRFLRNNPDAPQRLEVWESLVEIALNTRQEKETALSYLSIMQEEYAESPQITKSISLRLAMLYQELGSVTQAIPLWEKNLSESTLTNEEKARTYQSLSRAYLQRLEFTRAEEMLNLCTKLDVAPEIHFICRLQLAETQMLTENLPEAEKTLRQLIESGLVPANQQAEVIFLFADILEQLGKSKEAETNFLSIRDSYPNEKVIQLRINHIKKKD